MSVRLWIERSFWLYCNLFECTWISAETRSFFMAVFRCKPYIWAAGGQRDPLWNMRYHNAPSGWTFLPFSSSLPASGAQRCSRGPGCPPDPLSAPPASCLRPQTRFSVLNPAAQTGGVEAVGGLSAVLLWFFSPLSSPCGWKTLVRSHAAH